MNTKPKPILSIAKSLGIDKKYIESYGDYKAKISLDVLHKVKARKTKPKYIVVTGMTPTHLGEGKTVTAIGLSMALNRIGKKSVACIKEPSLGSLFGIKGGAAGGGAARAIPAHDIHLNPTGDIHAVEVAHNLCAAYLDNHLYRGNKLNIDPKRIFWHRVIDMNDRPLRSVRIGLNISDNGVERDSRFDIAAASEMMAIAALSESIPDLRKRLSRVVVALTRSGKPVTCEHLKCAGAMAALLSEVIKPNLVQTSENTPCFIHTDPFANITHGNSSILADKIGLRLTDYVITESAFGSDCGAEKFFNIKCRASGLVPDAAVLVCSIRALKAHSGMFNLVVGEPVDSRIYRENLNAVEIGCENLKKHIENIRLFGIPTVAVINRFSTDTAREIELVKTIALRGGAFHCVTSDIYRSGSGGGVNLANAVIGAAQGNSNFRYLYPLTMTIKEKIERIARQVYGAKGVRYVPKAEEDITLYQKLGFGKLPVCMAKTHLSISHDPKLTGVPRDFILPVVDVWPSTGAGFLYVLCEKTLTMRGLPASPIGEKIDIDSKGRILGLED